MALISQIRRFVRMRRRKKVFLHIGFHKTGSTAIQQFLGANRAGLEAIGMAYPHPLGTWPSHPELAWALCGNIFPWQDRPYSIDETVEHYAREIDSCPHRSIVLSSEEFCRLNFHPGTIAALAEILRPYDTRVIAYVRSARDFLASRYRHEVQERSEGRPFREFLACSDNIESARFVERVSPWIDAFGDSVDIRFYDRSQLVGESIIPDFFDAVGLDLRKLPVDSGPPRGDLEIPPTLAVFLSTINRSELDEPRKQRVFELAMSMAEIVGRRSANDLYEEINVPETITQLFERFDRDVHDLIRSRRRGRFRMKKWLFS